MRPDSRTFYPNLTIKHRPSDVRELLAHADVEHGLVDTSRSVETDQTYHRLRESAPEAGKDKA